MTDAPHVRSLEPLAARASRPDGPRTHAARLADAGIPPGLPDAVEPYLAELVTHVARLCGPALRGVYLLGSTAAGDHHAGRSDIDVAAIVTATPPRAAREELAAALDHASLPCPARKLEFVLYAQADLAAPEGPRYALNLNTGAGEPTHASFDPAEDPRYWFVLDIAIARSGAVALCGPPPGEVFPEIPRALVLRHLVDALSWYRDEDVSGPRVLAACRALRWARDGVWSPKGEAARWARAHVAAHRDVVAAALAERERDGPPPDERAATAFVDAVIHELRGRTT